MTVACFTGTKHRVSKKDFILDVRNLRTLFQHRPDTLLVPEEEVINRSRFSCKRHGPYLLVVLFVRICYMIFFTFTFFYLAFKAINHAHFQTLNSYNKFANERDWQLYNYSSEIETYYSNETDRMATEVEQRQYYCYGIYINLTADAYNAGAAALVTNISYQEAAPLSYVSLNVSSGDTIFITGDSACSTNTSDGAAIIERDVITITNATYVNNTYTVYTTYIRAIDYDRSSNNFTSLQTFFK